MKNVLFLFTFLMSFNIAHAEENNMTNNTLRLIYPQWQGGYIAQWIEEVKDKDAASRGYALGAELLNFLAPNSNQQTFTVPVTTEIKERKVIDGVYDRDDILTQTKAALKILEDNKPEKIVTLGGECSVSVVPFTYLANKYKDDVAVIWIDAHPDITLPGDVYPAYHAMAVTALMGDGEKQITSALPKKIDPSKILFVGLRDWERDEIKIRQQKYGIKHLTPKDVRDDSDKIIEWLKSTGANKVLIHFDMDVLDPKEMIAAVGVVPNGMTIDEVVRVINDVANEKEVVGLTVAEAMPRTAIRIKDMLSRLPLIK
mgnify:CR=1 FL=1